MRIILTGGGTGGHLFPLIAVAEKIKELNPQTEFFFIGPSGKMEKEVMERAGIPTRSVATGKVRRYFSFLNFLDVFRAPIGIFQAFWHLLVIMPDAIFSKGGYASMPVVVAGWFYRIPVLIHESDANPGMANSILAKFAKRVAVSYEEAANYFPPEQVVLTGNPLRKIVTTGDPASARQRYSLLESKKIIYVTGGSLGARNINNKILNILPELLHKYQVIHQTGDANYDEVTKKAGELGIKAGHGGYHPIAFVGEEVKDILAVADLVISRAGANTISEIAANKKPCILIPLNTAANDHQRMNAFSLAKYGACLVLEENNLGEHMLLSKIEEIMENQEINEKLRANIANFYHPDAAQKLAEGVLGMTN